MIDIEDSQRMALAIDEQARRTDPKEPWATMFGFMLFVLFCWGVAHLIARFA